jgi:CubicO group peptidase (beta-lactamase class C family)
MTTHHRLGPGRELDTFVAALAAQDRFSGSVLLTHRNRTVLARSYGMADKARGVPNGPNTIFALGSIPKLFTSVAVAQLAEQGKLGYTATVGTYLSGFRPEVADAVTIHQLLTHTSGLGDFHSPEYFELARTWNTVEEFWQGTLEFIRNAAPLSEPGSQLRYSNAGYVILGAIVAQLSGRSYYDYVRSRIFEPAGMTSTDFYTTPQWREDRRIAHPYAQQASGERVDTLDDNLLVGLPAGGAFASAPDLVRFAKAFQDNRLLGENYTHLTASPRLPMGPGLFAAYGPMAELRNGQWFHGHNGGSDGVSTNIDWFPESGWTAVVLANYDTNGDPMGPAGAVAGKARQLITSGRTSR